jgi:hypothetical protein
VCVYNIYIYITCIHANQEEDLMFRGVCGLAVSVLRSVFVLLFQ